MLFPFVNLPGSTPEDPLGNVAFRLSSSEFLNFRIAWAWAAQMQVDEEGYSEISNLNNTC